MKKIGLLLIISCLFLNGFSQDKIFLNQPYLETTAIVDTLVVPDRIYLSILITEKDTRGRTSVEVLEKRMIAKLIALGIDTKKQLNLSDVTSNFKNYFLKGTDIIKNKTYTLLVYNAETVGSVIDGLESIEISNVYLDKFEYSKLEEIKIDLNNKAVIRAKQQAESMLKPLNQRLGKAIYISDFDTNSTKTFKEKSSGIQSRSYGSTYEVIGMGIEPDGIEFEKITIESAITIKFKIE